MNYLESGNKTEVSRIIRVSNNKTEDASQLCECVINDVIYSILLGLDGYFSCS